MKLTRFAVLLLASVLALSALGAEKKKKIETVTDTIPTAKPSSYSGHSERGVTFSIGAVDGNFVFGPGFQMEWPLIVEGNEFAIGWQTGFYYTSASEEALGVKTAGKAFGIPLLATGKAQIASGISFLKPYFAIATGIGVDRTTAETNATGTTVKDTETDLHFVLLARPGLVFGDTQTWFAELPVGLFFTEFAIMPTIGMHF